MHIVESRRSGEPSRSIVACVKAQVRRVIVMWWANDVVGSREGCCNECPPFLERCWKVDVISKCWRGTNVLPGDYLLYLVQYMFDGITFENLVHLVRQRLGNGENGAKRWLYFVEETEGCR